MSHSRVVPEPESEPDSVLPQLFQQLNIAVIVNSSGASSSSQAQTGATPPPTSAAPEQPAADRTAGANSSNTAGHRYYAVWTTGGSTQHSGVHLGHHPAAWTAILALLPNRRYTPATANLRRYATLVAAIQGYELEAARHNSELPTRIFTH